MQHYLIIGASSGIGQVLALQLAYAGKHVIATFHKKEPASESPNIQFHHLSLVGFMFKRTRLFDIPIPILGTFEEMNLRFYVKRVDGDKIKRGVVS